MGRILFVTWDGGGNVPPALALADRLRARGHDVRGIGSETLAPRFDAEGIPYVARQMLAEWDQGAIARDVMAEAKRTADLVVSDYMLPGALCGAEAAGRPSVALVHTLYAANLDAHGGLLPMEMAASVVGTNDVRSGLGLRPVADFGQLLDGCQTLLVTSPVELDAPLAVRPSNVRYVGPVLQGPGPDAGWHPPGADTGPLVVVGLGTTPMDEAQVVQRVLHALAGAPVRVLVTVGPHLDTTGFVVPANATVSRPVRHAAVLPWASVVVTHAGLGTILAALAHGLPLVCLPLGREQPANAAAVERVEAGITLDQLAPAPEIRAAVMRLTDDLERRAGAARMAVRIAELDADHAAEREIESLL